MTDIIVIFLSFFFFLPCHSDGDIIVLHMYTKNYNHMMYSSWDRVRDGGTDLIKKCENRQYLTLLCVNICWWLLCWYFTWYMVMIRLL